VLIASQRRVGDHCSLGGIVSNTNKNQSLCSGYRMALVDARDGDNLVADCMGHSAKNRRRKSPTAPETLSCQR
jgi:hypothetical protein